ncbi:MAG: hypothetical protein GY710_06175 [Desulfobacteraceae bacterium]|nr:hypothetical protein [Desulfobacteraceae bacterium]
MPKKCKDVFKTDYPGNYRYYCKGYLNQIIASNNKESLKRALNDWPKSNYNIKKVVDNG